MKKLILITAIIFLSACTSIPAKIVLPLPPPVDYPKIQASALECLRDSDYKILVTRDKLKSARINTLEGIIKSTH